MSNYFITTQYKGSAPLYVADLFLNPVTRQIVFDLLGYYPGILHTSRRIGEDTNYIAIQTKEETSQDEKFGGKFWSEPKNFDKYLELVSSVIREADQLSDLHKKGEAGTDIETLKAAYDIEVRITALHYATEVKLLEPIQKVLNSDQIEQIAKYRWEEQNRTFKMMAIFESVVKKLAQDHSINPDDIQAYRVEDILRLLEKSQKLSDQETERRKFAWAYVLGLGVKEINFIVGDDVLATQSISSAWDYVLKEIATSSGKLKAMVGSCPSGKEEVLGTAYVISKTLDPNEELKKMPGDRVLVITQTYPDYVPYMKRCRAIVADVGGIASHAAIVSREMGIPCVVGTKYATRIYKTGDQLKINLKTGEVERIK